MGSNCQHLANHCRFVLHNNGGSKLMQTATPKKIYKTLQYIEVAMDVFTNTANTLVCTIVATFAFPLRVED